MPESSDKSEFKPHLGKLRWILNDWYGRERGETELNAYLAPPEEIDKVLDKVIDGIISPEDLQLVDLKENWAQIAGPQIARIATPLNIRDQVLTVEVRHSAWLRELKGSVKNIILGKIRKLCGEDFCIDIRFVPLGSSPLR